MDALIDDAQQAFRRTCTNVLQDLGLLVRPVHCTFSGRYARYQSWGSRTCRQIASCRAFEYALAGYVIMAKA